MSFLICTGHVDKDYELGQLTKTHKIQYARRHRYDFRSFIHSLDITRPPAWSKVLFIKQFISMYSWVFWIDADALIMDPEIKLDSLIDENFDFICCGNEKGELNTGTFLIRGSTWSAGFLDTVWRHKLFTFERGWEEWAIIDLMKRSPEIRTRIKLIPHKQMNSLYKFDMYSKGDFICHLADMNQELKLRTAQDLLSSIDVSKDNQSQ